MHLQELQDIHPAGHMVLPVQPIIQGPARTTAEAAEAAEAGQRYLSTHMPHHLLMQVRERSLPPEEESMASEAAEAAEAAPGPIPQGLQVTYISTTQAQGETA